jgi:glycosyltransferase involved in cell wall biosynthesis
VPDAPAFSIVCLSSQVWDAPLPTNRQQIMSRAARRGHRVLFVETGGFLGRHLWRLVRGPERRLAARKLAMGIDVAPGIRVQQLANIFPFAQRYRWCNRLNWKAGALPLRRAVRRMSPPSVLWIYDPRGSDAIGTFAEAFAVYDCVDDYQHQASPRARTLVAEHDRLAADRARLVFVTTDSLFERHGRDRDGVHLVPNVGDFEHFRGAVDRGFALDDLRTLPRPVLGFVGNITENKIDFDLFAALATAFPDGTVLIAGPAEGRARDRVGSLMARFANVRWIGLQPYSQVPSVVAAFDVALVPYISSPYTASVFPLKIYEYLAAGKPVVASGVPSVAGLAPHVLLADSHASFVAAARKAISLPEEAASERQRIASRNTWDQRTGRLLELVGEELAA